MSDILIGNGCGGVWFCCFHEYTIFLEINDFWLLQSENRDELPYRVLLLACNFRKKQLEDFPLRRCREKVRCAGVAQVVEQLIR
ncbi:MAG: hypothetical protein J7M09_03535, partial [Deltaproteobacteria bacterium]|nr:hypothetical protein [Candidatus Tharpella sp.]